MSDAADAFEEAFAQAKTAANAIRLGRDGFTFSPTSGVFDASDWDDIDYGLLMTDKVATQFVGSLSSPTHSVYAVMPMDWDEDYRVTAWPTASDIGDTAVGVNLGRFFSNPVSLVASIVELNKGSPLPNPAEHVGEPVWYKLNAASGSFSKVTGPGGDLPANHDFSSRDGTVYFWRAPDATLGGVGDIDNIPLDDPATRYNSFAFGLEDFNDNVVDNDKWDPGEEIYGGDLYTDVEGVINLGFVSSSYGTDHDPYEWYFEPNFTSSEGRPDSLLSAYTATDNVDEFWAALEDHVYIHEDGKQATQVFLNTTTRELYYNLGFADYVAWNSYVAEGTTGSDWDGVSMTSTGSVWWFGLDELKDMLSKEEAVK
jgi:hypothetical protein